jgi:uncharacterized protein (TIGR03435 family)
VRIAQNRNFRRNGLLSIIGLAILAAPVLFGFTNAIPSPAQAEPQVQAQAAPAAGPVFEYEVATIKPSGPLTFGSGKINFGIRYTDDGFIVSSFPLKAIMQLAYGVQGYQISGGPDWVGSDRFDIDAKMDSAAAEAMQKLSPEDRALARKKMLATLLEDRFELTIHRESKELPVYTLVIGKNGPKLQEAKPRDPGASAVSGPNAIAVPKGSFQLGGTVGGASDGLRHISLPNVPMGSLASILTQQLGKPVLDKTGLTGKYDLKLDWAPDDAQGDVNGPSIFTAVQEQLGLKLESGKDAAELIVIDHVEKPSGN